MAPASHALLAAAAALLLLAVASLPAQSAAVHPALGRRHRPHRRRPLPPPRGAPLPPSSRECIFFDYDRNANLTSFEFQLQPHRGLVWDFERAASTIEALMLRLTERSRDAQAGGARRVGGGGRGGPRPLRGRRWPAEPANFTLVEGSRWDTVLREHAFAVSSRRGAPLHPWRGRQEDEEDGGEREGEEEGSAGGGDTGDTGDNGDRGDSGDSGDNGDRNDVRNRRHPFPWRRLAYLRLRRTIVTMPPGSPGAPPPGAADLALKMKKIDPSLGPLQPGAWLFAPGVRAKLEADVHCDHQRVSVSPLFSPVPGSLNVSTVGSVAAYFPGLARLAGVAPDERLPFCHAVWRRKATWAVVYRGLVGEVGLVAKYNTTLSDAAAGRRAKNGEVSLRIRREVAGGARAGGGDERALRNLAEALDALAGAAQLFRDEGWDGKTPGTDGKLPPRRGRRPGGDPAAEGVAALLREAGAEGFVAGAGDDEREDEEEVVCERGGSKSHGGGSDGDAPLPRERRAPVAKEASASASASAAVV